MEHVGPLIDREKRGISSGTTGFSICGFIHHLSARIYEEKHIYKESRCTVEGKIKNRNDLEAELRRSEVEASGNCQLLFVSPCPSCLSSTSLFGTPSPEVAHCLLNCLHNGTGRFGHCVDFVDHFILWITFKAG
jgi:hypothetical protein